MAADWEINGLAVCSHCDFTKSRLPDPLHVAEVLGSIEWTFVICSEQRNYRFKFV